MAIYYPDLSHYDINRGVTVVPGTVAVFAKATHGTSFLDSGYATIREQALAVGAIFGAYHWLNHGDGAAQADYCYSQVGATPCMVDAEDMPGNTGYAGYLTVQDIVDFVTRLRARGGICHLVYLPRWYWDQHMGGPSLQPLRDLGVGLVASRYTTYSDTGPGWSVYVRDNGTVEPSGMRPTVWQYTDALPYGGSTADFNAFRGTVDEFQALITGKVSIVALADEQVPEFKRPDSPRLFDPGISYGITEPAPGWSWATALRTMWWQAYESQNEVLRTRDMVHDVQNHIETILTKIDGLTAPAAPTQDQVDQAVLKALQDPTVAKGIGDAIASHLHVS